MPAGLAALTVWLSFNAGGFFALETALAAIVAGAALLLFVTMSARPLAGMGPWIAVATAALVVLAVWTLVSSTWSDAPARSLLEFDRILLYLFVVVLVGLACGAPRGRRDIVRAVAAALVVVAAAGLATHLLPEALPTNAAREADRLSFPLTYWNALGLMAGLGLVACLHLGAGPLERAAVRVAACAAWPMLACTLFFTFSRGAMAVVPVALLAYLVVARPRGGLGAVLAVAPPTAAAVAVAYGAEALATQGASGSAAVSEGRSVALVVVACMVAAALLRLLTLRLDGRRRRERRPNPRLRRTLTLAGAAAVLAVVVSAAALDAPGFAERQYREFADVDYVSSEGDRRERLGQIGNNGRIDHWRSALEGFDERPLTGNGAGTYEQLWALHRTTAFDVVDGHSLYFEVLGELGLVGLSAVLVAIVALLAGALRLVRSGERELGGVAFALVLLWALHAGVDWDWEMPAVTVPVLAVGAAVAGGAGRPLPDRIAAPPSLARVLMGLGCLLLVITPVLIVRSQLELDRAVAGLRGGDCPAAVDSALAATSALSVRPEPFEVLGYCDVRLGRPDLAVRAFDAAIARDPSSWRLYYGRALVRASAGLDPRPAARRALRLNPLSPLARDAVREFRTDDPKAWRRAAARARLPF